MKDLNDLVTVISIIIDIPLYQFIFLSCGETLNNPAFNDTIPKQVLIRAMTVHGPLFGYKKRTCTHTRTPICTFSRAQSGSQIIQHRLIKL